MHTVMKMANRRNEVVRIIEGLEVQGVRTRPTHEGWFIYLPDGTATSLHRSGGSEYRSLRNFRSLIERQHLVWPLDPEFKNQVDC